MTPITDEQLALLRRMIDSGEAFAEIEGLKALVGRIDEQAATIVKIRTVVAQLLAMTTVATDTLEAIAELTEEEDTQLTAMTCLESLSIMMEKIATSLGVEPETPQGESHDSAQS